MKFLYNESRRARGRNIAALENTWNYIAAESARRISLRQPNVY